MGRWLAVAVVVVTTGSAQAAPKKKVLIQSTPEKASVYVGSVEEGEKCKTPCTIEVDSESIVIVDLAGHKPKSEAIIIKRTEKAPYKRSYKLIKSVGTLKVEGPSGASVFVDNADTGKIPFEEDVAAGSHVVTVKVDGKEVYSAAVEVPEDEDFKITVPAKAVAKKDPDDDDDTDPKTDTTPAVTKKATPSAPRAGNLFAISTAFSVGFRDFTYRKVDPMTTRTDLGPENEGGQVLAGVFAEVWPGNLLGVRFLRGLALVGRAQLGVNSQQVIKDNDNSKLGATTFWRSFEGSLRQRGVLASTAAFEISVGYTRDIHSFTGNAINVPSVDYQSLKIGGRASILLGQLEPYLAVENRVVMSGGQLGDRFQGANASGVRGALGIDMRFGHISGKLEGSLMRYSWTFNNDPMNDAEGATDSIKQVGLFLGYAY